MSYTFTMNKDEMKEYMDTLKTIGFHEEEKNGYRNMFTRLLQELETTNELSETQKYEFLSDQVDNLSYDNMENKEDMNIIVEQISRSSYLTPEIIDKIQAKGLDTTPFIISRQITDEQLRKMMDDPQTLDKCSENFIKVLKGEEETYGDYSRFLTELKKNPSHYLEIATGDGEVKSSDRYTNTEVALGFATNDSRVINTLIRTTDENMQLALAYNPYLTDTQMERMLREKEAGRFYTGYDSKSDNDIRYALYLNYTLKQRILDEGDYINTAIIAKEMTRREVGMKESFVTPFEECFDMLERSDNQIGKYYSMYSNQDTPDASSRFRNSLNFEYMRMLSTNDLNMFLMTTYEGSLQHIAPSISDPTIRTSTIERIIEHIVEEDRQNQNTENRAYTYISPIAMNHILNRDDLSRQCLQNLQYIANQWDHSEPFRSAEILINERLNAEERVRSSIRSEKQATLADLQEKIEISQEESKQQEYDRDLDRDIHQQKEKEKKKEEPETLIEKMKNENDFATKIALATAASAAAAETAKKHLPKDIGDTTL